MKAKRLISLACAGAFLLPMMSAMSGCSGKETIVLRVYNWEEYIDDGGEGSYVFDTLKEELAPDLSDKEFEKWYANNYRTPLAPSMIDDFEEWYKETYGMPVRVEYSTFGTNEDLYNQLKLGDKYDLVCPSDYMLMKLIAEDMVEPLTEDFFDDSVEENYYAHYVSPFIAGVFADNYVSVQKDETIEKRVWGDYAAGYMWGTTGLIYNPETVDEDDLSNWSIMLNKRYANKVTTKDNVRDSYFVGLAILYEEQLLALRARHEAGELTDADYNAQLTEIMNKTDEETVKNVQKVLTDMKKNIYGFETDTGKSDLVKGTISLNFAWSGDAVYALDLAESKDNVYLKYFVPEECANLWFDGWVMPKGANTQAAQAFVNFISMPENAIRNMYYIGYSSVIAGDEIFGYVEDTYSAEDDDDTATDYDLSYFFGEGATLRVPEEQLERQLYAQYPTEEVMLRCAVMDYFGEEDGERINELWTKVRGELLDAWAIAVICAGAVATVAFLVFIKLGGKIDFFRRKPKKGYVKVDQKPVR